VGSLTKVAVARDYAYAAVDSRLHIIDVSQPAQPRPIGLYNFPSSVEDLVIDRTTLYVAAGSTGLRTMSLANPAAPTQIGTFTGTTQAHDLAVAGNFVYLADDDLRVIDVSNPAHPVQVGFLGRYNQFTTRVTVSGTIAYVIDFRPDPDAFALYTLRVIDISNPSSPIQIGKYPWWPTSGVEGWVGDMGTRGTYLYLAMSGASWNFQPFDVSTPSNPVRITPGHNPPSRACYSLDLLDPYVFIANDTAGVRILDLSNPTAPTEIGFYDTLGAASDIEVVGRYVYIADGPRGLAVLWFAPPTSTTLDTAGGTLVSGIDQTTYDFSSSVFADDFPGDVFTDTAIVTHTPRYPGNLPPTGDLIGIDHFFEVTAVYSSTGLPAQPTQPYTLTVQYTDQEKGPAIEGTLALYSWDGNQWAKEPSSVVDVASNTVTATPNHFSVWAVLGETHRLYLPVIRKSL
jgi:hypothetical protein